MIASSRELPASGLAGSQREATRPAGRSDRVERAVLPSSRWPMIFVSFEFACQVALLFPQLSSLRIVLRSAPFVVSLVLLAVLRGRKTEYHPARAAAVVIILILAVSMLHPLTNSFASGAATVLFNLAIFGPIFWVPRLRLDTDAINRLVLLFWGFQTASAALGALQVYFPGRFQPAMSAVFTDEMLAGLRITLADGTRVFRPMGLTDAPGGAALGGMYTVLFSMALWLERRRLLFRIVLLFTMALGLFVLYLCQVRSLLVMLIPAFFVSVWPHLSTLRFGRAVAIVAPLVVTALVAFSFAVAVGGDSMINRLSTLIESDPRAVYYSNRGFFVEATFNDLLPQYPLGAGLGRWGMMSVYFGDRYNAASPALWAEIQWTAWLYDGGVPLMLAGAAAMLIAFREALRMAKSKIAARHGLSGLAGILLGYSVGIIAITFNACPFAGTLGVDFWLLNAAVFAAVYNANQSSANDSSGTRAPQRLVAQR